MTTIADAGHDLFTTGHITDPYIAYFVFGNPLLGLAVAGLWEILEQFTYETRGDYTSIFLGDDWAEPVWDIVFTDIGGAAIGTLIAAVATYFFEGQFTPKNPIWKEQLSIRAKIMVVFWFVFRAILTMPLSSIGWHCKSVMSFFCLSDDIDNGFNALAWGILPIMAINITYLWLTFRKKPRSNEFDPKLATKILLYLIICAPTFQRAVASGYIQIVVYGPTILFVYLCCFGHYLYGEFNKENRMNRKDFTQLNTEEEDV